LDDGEHGVTVIDTGMPHSVNAIVDTVKAIGRTVGDIKQILVTHADIDHIGSLAPLVTASNAKIIAGNKSKHYIESRLAPPHGPVFLRPIMWMLMKVLLCKVTVDQVVKQGDVLPIAGGIRVLAIPGHTPDNMGFLWERHQVLFVPDLLWRNRNMLELMPAMITWNVQMAKDSLKQAMQHNPQYICVGHGQFVDQQTEPEQIKNLVASV
jgi:glyoxylase-like metal-dependent hydrolase (beta-lactamase superfamily II)